VVAVLDLIMLVAVVLVGSELVLLYPLPQEQNTR
jgi:hypothetical protein